MHQQSLLFPTFCEGNAVSHMTFVQYNEPRGQREVRGLRAGEWTETCRTGGLYRQCVRAACWRLAADEACPMLPIDGGTPPRSCGTILPPLQRGSTPARFSASWLDDCTTITTHPLSSETSRVRPCETFHSLSRRSLPPVIVVRGVSRPQRVSAGTKPDEHVRLPSPGAAVSDKSAQRLSLFSSTSYVPL